MTPDILMIVFASVATGMFAGVGLVGAVQYIHERRILGELGRKDGAA